MIKVTQNSKQAATRALYKIKVKDSGQYRVWSKQRDQTANVNAM